MKIVTIRNNKGLVIREAQVKDAQKILDYLNIIAVESDFLTFGEGELGISIKEEIDFIEDCLKSDNKLFLVGEMDGEIVSTLNFIAGKRPRIKHAGELGISVLKKYWGLGIGKEMIVYLIEWAKSNNKIKKMNLRVREDNVRGIALYERLGFVKEGFITREFKINDRYYGCYHMGLEID